MFRFTVICLCVSAIWALPSLPTRHIKGRKFTGPRIINGDQAQAGQFPWQVALFIDDDEDTWFCGGAIISEEWILTAGHCVDGAVNGQVSVGTLDPYGGDAIDVSRFILHKDYDGNSLENDIGLIQLAKPLSLGGNTAAVSLASQELATDVSVTVSGWGLTSDSSNTISDELNYVELVTISTSDCDAYYGDGSTLPEMVCANSATSQVKSTCSGDSGGPGVIDAGSNPVHVAIVSFGSVEGCESGAPSGLTRTAYYRDWIQSNTGV